MIRTEELACLAKRVKNDIPNVETFSLATIYGMLKEHEKETMNLSDFKEFICYLTGWDISFQIIRSQLEINQIVL